MNRLFLSLPLILINLMISIFIWQKPVVEYYMIPIFHGLGGVMMALNIILIFLLVGSMEGLQ